MRRKRAAERQEQERQQGLLEARAQRAAVAPRVVTPSEWVRGELDRMQHVPEGVPAPLTHEQEVQLALTCRRDMWQRTPTTVCAVCARYTPDLERGPPPAGTEDIHVDVPKAQRCIQRLRWSEVPAQAMLRADAAEGDPPLDPPCSARYPRDALTTVEIEGQRYCLEPAGVVFSGRACCQHDYSRASPPMCKVGLTAQCYASNSDFAPLIVAFTAPHAALPLPRLASSGSN